MPEKTRSREELDKAWGELDAQYGKLIDECACAPWTLAAAGIGGPLVMLIVLWLRS